MYLYHPGCRSQIEVEAFAEEITLTPRQILLVQETFEAAVPIADTVATLFHERLINLDPSLRSLLPSDAQSRGTRLMAILETVVRGLDRPEKIAPAVRHLGQWGVQPAQYQTVGEALTCALKQGLGDAFTDEVHEAWVAAYTWLATVMQEVAEIEPAQAGS